MINEKYYNDIKEFAGQFEEGFAIAEDLKIEGSFDSMVVCGMGGSTLYVDLVNDLLASEGSSFQVNAVRNYHLPNYVDESTLVISASYSGNTEETLSCFQESQERSLHTLAFTTGGKLLAQAKEADIPVYLIPKGLQPRLSTGYFIAGLVSVLHKIGVAPNVTDTVLESVKDLDHHLDEEKAKNLADELHEQVPIVYSTAINSSIARVSKIKFNENSKTQAFWNYFPEVNHNEMVGFTNIVMKPHFLICKSQFSDERNQKRIDIFTRLMKDRDLPVTTIDMQGDSVFAEMMNAYYFIDHVTYYLAENYSIDPEPVDMVEEFKEMMKE